MRRIRFSCVFQKKPSTIISVLTRKYTCNKKIHKYIYKHMFLQAKSTLVTRIHVRICVHKHAHDQARTRRQLHVQVYTCRRTGTRVHAAIRAHTRRHIHACTRKHGFACTCTHKRTNEHAHHSGLCTLCLRRLRGHETHPPPPSGSSYHMVVNPVAGIPRLRTRVRAHKHPRTRMKKRTHMRLQIKHIEADIY